MLALPPKIIGICGQPGHGKTTVQNMLADIGVRAIDDRAPIRRLGMQRYGLSVEDVSTQHGKQRLMTLPDGRRVTVRQALGELGYEGEALDPNFWTEEAIRDVRASGSDQPVSFGSIRMWQGHSIKRCGGLVIEVRNVWRADSCPFFDQYDRRPVDLIIENDGDLTELRERVVAGVASYLNAERSGLWD